ncbi:hypothetical protein HN51_039175 [Arachis hypogaea]|nr:Endoglucanase [Arachis hypogaea]
MTMLSWSILKYNRKYESALELDRVKHAIKRAAASIVFHDNEAYSKKLIHGAGMVFEFAIQGLGDEYSDGGDPPSLSGMSSCGAEHSVFSWDNKLPGAVLLFARFRMSLDYG